MSESVGRVHLDLGIDYSKFNKQLNGIQNTATNQLGGAFKKLGGVIAGAFAVHSLIGFGREAINLASDLQEVQNVVDVTFGQMANHVNNFAKNALHTFGLSELSAKKYASTMGAMLKSSGLTGNAVVQLSEELTALSADFASFYNLDTETAFNKIRAGISGETEPLKQLGINMSVANLEAFALTQGITKQFNAMSQAEQVMLRYNYLMKVSADAQGDFARNSDSWANQTRVLTEQWRIFQGTMGQGFINVLAPVVKMLNGLIARLQVAAQYFRAFTEIITGKKQEVASTAVVTEEVASGIGEVGSEAKKAAKAVKGSVSGFDQLNIIGQAASDSLSDTADSLGGIGGGIDIGEIGNIPAPEIDTDEFVAKVQGMVDRVKSIMGTMFAGNYGAQLSQAFAGLRPALQPLIDMQLPIQYALLSIGNTAMNLYNTFLKPLGDYLILDFVPSIVTSFTESFAPVFADVALFAVQTFAESFANYTQALSDLLNATWIPAIDQVKVAYMEAFPLIAETIQSVLDNTIKPFVDYFINQFVLPIAVAIQETLVPILSDIAVFAIQEFVKWFQWGGNTINDIYATIIKPVFDNIKRVVLDTLTIVKNLWEEYGQILLNNISQLMDRIRGLFQQLWDVMLKPIIEPFLKMLTWLWDKHLKGLVEELGKFIMKLVNGALEIFNKFIMPIVSFLIDLLGPTFASVFSFVADVLGTALGVVIDIAKGIIQSLGGIIDFIVGVFTGDWNKAWEGIKDFFGGIFDGIVGIFKGAINLIIDGLNFLIRQLNKVSFDIPDWVPVIGGKSFGLNIPEVPKLAKGGMVTAPTLAMVGDNRNAQVDPEVVSPVSKLRDMLAYANQGVIEALMMILDAIERQELIVEMDGEKLTRALRSRLEKENVRVGGSRVMIGGTPV